MDIEWLILSDGAQVVGSKLFLMGGGWDRLQINGGFPKQHPIGLAIAIKVPWNETNEKHAFSISFESEDGVSIETLSGNFEVGRPTGSKPGQDQRAQFAVNAIINFAEPGTFVVIASIDGEERRRVPFNVLSGTPVPA